MERQALIGALLGLLIGCSPILPAPPTPTEPPAPMGNQVGVIQAKTGGKASDKEGLRELNAACGREFLGIYTAKILVINQKWDHTLENLRDLAKAWNIAVVELPSFTAHSPFLSPEDQERLR